MRVQKYNYISADFEGGVNSGDGILKIPACGMNHAISSPLQNNNYDNYVLIISIFIRLEHPKIS